MPPLDPLVASAEYQLRGWLARHLPYRELSRRTGASRAQLYDIQTGRAHLSRSRAEQVLDRLNGRDWRVNVPTDAGREWVNPTRQEAYGLAMEHEKALEKVAENGGQDMSPLRKFRDKSIEYVDNQGRKQRIRLLDDRDGPTIRRLMNEDQLLSDTVTHGGSRERRVR
jgi:hypothetical protein